MEILIGIVVGVAGAAIVALVVARGRREAELAASATMPVADVVAGQVTAGVAESLVAEVRRLADEQRRGAEAARDAAITAALEQLMVGGKALMDSERELAGRDLDGKKSPHRPAARAR